MGTQWYSMVLNESDTISQSLFPLFVKDVKVDQDAAAAVESQDSAVEAENAAFTAEMDARGVTASPDTTEAKDVSQLFKSLLQQVSNEASDLTVARMLKCFRLERQQWRPALRSRFFRRLQVMKVAMGSFRSL